jgi:hypothetical protein
MMPTFSASMFPVSLSVTVKHQELQLNAVDALEVLAVAGPAAGTRTAAAVASVARPHLEITHGGSSSHLVLISAGLSNRPSLRG